MAVWAATANGNLTSSSTWKSCDSTSYSNSESANTALTTSQVSSSTFTPGAITIDGIGVKIASRAASPTGTITVELTQGGSLVTGTNVTINVSDLPTCTATSGTTTPVATAEGGWVFFKFGSPVTLVGATAYAVSAATSSSSQVNLWSAATTNWSRYLRTTTTGAPAAADDLIITGEWTAAATVTARTVTMDSTASTAYGSNTTSQVTPALSICNNGTLSYGTAASTNYQFVLKGYVIVYNGGTLSVGTVSTPIPGTSTATTQQTCTADGDFGIVVRNGGIFNSYGSPRTSGKLKIRTLLTANLAAAATSATVADDTGWLNGDVVILPSTTTTFGQFEKLTLNANATSSGLSFSAGAANAHSGISPIQCEVGLLTRNVLFTGGSSSVMPFLYFGTSAAINIQWSEFNQYGSNSTTGKVCMNVNNVTGTFNIQYSSIHDCRGSCIYVQGSNWANITIQNVVFYNWNLASAIGAWGINLSSATTATNWLIDQCLLCGDVSGSNTSGGITLADVGGTLTNTSITSTGVTNSGALSLNESNTLGTFDSLIIHSNNGTGINFAAVILGTISNSDIWRNAGQGVVLSGNNGVSFTDYLAFKSCRIFGNPLYGAGATGAGNYIFDNCTIAGDTSFNQAYVFQGVPGGTRLRFYSCTLSVASGIFIACASGDFNFGSGFKGEIDILIDNCLIRTGGLTLVNAPGIIGPILSYQNFNQTANDNRQYFVGDNNSVSTVIQTNTSTVYGTNSRSEQMSPSGFTTSKLSSASIFVATPSGKAATPVVQVRKNSSYTGNAPRLILKRQDSMGVTADTVLQTFSAGADTWQGLTGTTSAAPQDGIFEFVVDCDGSAGSVFVGDATATVA